MPLIHCSGIQSHSARGTNIWRAGLHCARVLTVASSIGLAVAGMGEPAQAQPRPQIETTLVDGTDNVYIFRNGNAQSMFVVTPAGVIATDPIAYGKPTGGQDYVDEIRKVTDKPIKFLIYSHHHLDHIAGGQAFKDAGATIIAHQRTKSRLALIVDPNTPLPDQTVTDRGKMLSLGGVTLELKYVGRNHSDSMLVIRLLKQKLIFLADVIPVGQVPGRGMIDTYPFEYEDSIRSIMALAWDRMIPGHPGPSGRLGTKQDAKNFLTLLQEASAEMKPLAQAGKCWDQAEKEFKLENYKNWPGYKAGLPFIAQRYCLLWGRGT
jgi:glyoxylase-like metal-dependent hydrolase (beta-lactamase superfamily II)